MTDPARLGLDVGEQRIGVAVVAGGELSARPLTTLRRAANPATDAAAIARLLAEHRAAGLVVGLPLEAAGQEGTQAARTRAWVAGIAPLLPGEVAIEFQDERLTSHLAEQRLGPMPRGRSGGPPTRHQREAYRARVDREAAAIILQDALDTRRTAHASQTEPTPSPTETRA